MITNIYEKQQHAEKKVLTITIAVHAILNAIFT